MLHIDFETRSRIDLKKAGAHRYAMDYSTEIICLAYAFDDEEPDLWIPGYSFPKRITAYVEDGGRIDAYNAQFERLIWWYILEPEYGAPKTRLDQFYCSAAQSRVNGLPGALGDTARCLGVEQQKTFEGNALIRQLSILQADGTFNKDPALLQKMYDYCKQDVRTERAISRAMREMTEDEEQDFYLSEEINDRGIRVDYEFAKAAIEYAAEEQADILAELSRLSGGQVTKARGQKLTGWVYSRLTESQQEIIHVWKKGQRKVSFDKQIRARLLGSDASDYVKKIIELADYAQASSTGKYAAMVASADPEDYRVRGVFMFCGAISTGRFSGHRIQPQNFPRDSLENPDEVRQLFIDNVISEDISEWSGFNMMQTLKRMLRYTLRSESGNVLVAGDWSSIEGRALPWLADETKKLDEYREGVDMYVKMASQIYNVSEDEVTKDQRQIGKVAELALGYGGGVGAFQSMAAGYGVKVTDAEAERIKRVWRSTNPWAEPFWNGLHRAAILAVRNPGKVFTQAKISYCYNKEFLNGALFCLLPSGRMLTYPNAKVNVVVNKFGHDAIELSAIKANWKPKQGEKDWPRIRLWRGLLAENVTQAICADLLRSSLRKLRNSEKVIAHVHDEIVLEVPERQVKRWSKELHRAMTENDEWSEGLPLETEVWSDTRYKK